MFIRKESEELREQLKSRGLTHTMLSTALKEANREMRKWRLEATLKQCQLELQPGDCASEDVLTKKIDEEMGEARIELKQTKKGPHLACKKGDNDIEPFTCEKRADAKKKNSVADHNEVKEVITINDSTDDVFIIKSGCDEHQESCSKAPEEKALLSILKHNENIVKTEDTEGTEDKGNEVVHVKGEICEEKENISGKIPRSVTFSKNTLSPRATDRTMLKANCKRLVVPKPIYIPSE